MIIDFHTHIFPDKIAPRTIAKLEKNSHTRAYTDGTLEGLKRSMKEAKVDVSVILPVVTKPEQFKSINEYARSITVDEVLPGRCNLISFGGIHPMTSNYKEEIDEIAAMGLKGVKLHPDYQETFIDDISYLRIMDRASEKGLIISVHAGLDVGLPQVVHCTPKGVRNALKQVQPQKLVLAHTGGMECWYEVEEHLVGTDVYLDCSYSLGRIADEQFIRIAKNHGIEKILFATDSPWSGQKEDIAYLKKLGFSDEEKEAIFWKNAWKLLGMQGKEIW